MRHANLTLCLCVTLIASSAMATPLASIYPQAQPGQQHTSLTADDANAIVLLGLKPNMTRDAVAALGVKLTPYGVYSPQNPQGIHAYYGLNTYRATALPKQLSDGATYLLSFNQKNQLKMIQIESQPFAEQGQLARVSQRISQLRDGLETLFGPAHIQRPRGTVTGWQQALKIYQLNTDNLLISVAPIVKSIHKEQMQSAYVIKYSIKTSKNYFPGSVMYHDRLQNWIGIA